LYHLPTEIAKIIREHYHDKKTILDLGCGTGLLGNNINSKDIILYGVDISSKMLKKAERRGMYHKLYNKDIEEFFDNCTTKFDIIVALDVFIYFGNIGKLLIKLKHHLHKGGVLIFSTESNTVIDSFSIQRNMRFCHNPEYIKGLLELQGFALDNVYQIDLRKNIDEIVKGDLFICSKRESNIVF
jgi:predicted TPR repeat methyltransferase